MRRQAIDAINWVTFLCRRGCGGTSPSSKNAKEKDKDEFYRHNLH